MAVRETGRTAPVLLAVTKTGCLPVVPVEREPTAMTVPSAPAVALSTDWVAALPSDPVGCQVPPVPPLV
jgi:hypothetical protein